MKIHIITIGSPRLTFAKEGWSEYLKRLHRYHSIQTTHLIDKYADDAITILKTAGNSYKIALAIDGRQFSSQELAVFLETRALETSVLSCIIGGPNGLPFEVINKAETVWSLSKLTFPHDLAMVMTLEALYRASTITIGHPYHRQ